MSDCKTCGGGIQVVKNVVNVAKNITQAVVENPDKVRWFKDGSSGLIKVLTNEKSYSDEDIIKNRNICKSCEFATNKNEKGNLTMTSQCMYPDPNNNNAPCGCFLLAKTQVGSCPANKWVEITIKNS